MARVALGGQFCGARNCKRTKFTLVISHRTVKKKLYARHQRGQIDALQGKCIFGEKKTTGRPLPQAMHF